MAKNTGNKVVVIKADERYPIEGREMEYIMTRGEYDYLMDKDRAPRNVHRNKYILDYVNSVCGILGTVTTVRIED